MKKLALFLIFISFCGAAQASINKIEEVDGSPAVYPWKIIVSNGTLTDNGDGTVSLTTGGGSGGGYDTIKEEGSSLTQRTNMNFIGKGISASDDGVSTTNITLYAATATQDGVVTTLAQSFAGVKTFNSPPTSPSSGTASEAFGSGSSATNTNSTALGNTAASTGSGATVIGQGSSSSASNSTVVGQGISIATSSGQTAIGQGAQANGQNSISIGLSANARQPNCIAIGQSTTSGGGSSSNERNIVIGSLANAQGDNSVSIGYSAAGGTSANKNVTIGSSAAAIANMSNCIILGASATNTASNQFVAGSTSSPIDNAYFGNGVTNSTPTQIRFNATGGSGTNIIGGDLNLAGGISTGNAFGGAINLQTSDPGSSGTTAQTLSTKMTISKDGVTTVLLDGYPDVSGYSSGPQVSTYKAGESISTFDLVFISSDGNWYKTDADAASTSGGVLLGTSLESKTAGNAMKTAFKGSIIRNSSWSFTPGAALYVSTSAGAITATQPSGTDDVIRVVGFALSADAVYFDPSPDFLTHV